MQSLLVPRPNSQMNISNPRIVSIHDVSSYSADESGAIS
jgi:hypothetical protein